MFEGAQGRPSGATGRVWTGAIVSVGLHAGLLTAAIWLSSGGEVKPSAEPPDFKGPVQIDFSKVARGSPTAAARPAAQPKPKPKRPRQPVQAPVTVARPVEVEPPAELEPITGGGEEPVVGKEIGGEGPRGHALGSCEGPGCLTEVPPGAGVQEYRGGEMTPPVLLSGEAPEYTREALQARVEGTMIVKCVITRTGSVTSCRVIKGLPHMEQEVLQALTTRRYKPVTIDGQPIDVNYVLNIRVHLPR